MSAGFTPGPWFAADGGVVWHEAIVEVSHPECCGDIRPNGECCGLSVQGSHQELAQEQLATCSPEDADLIAAAPELYEALLLVSRNSGKLSYMDWQAVEAVLAKARGEQ